MAADAKSDFDEDNPEWTEADFAVARPGREVLPREVLEAFGKRRGRPSRAAAKRVVSLRLRPSLIAAYEALGKDWRARMETILTRELENIQR